MTASCFDISAIIPVYNGQAYVGEAVESVLRQTRPVREVIVVDDGSTDSTPEVLKSFGGRVRVITQANAGLPAARNSGARATGGQWLGFLDADDRWSLDKVRLVEQYLPGQDDCGVIYGAAEHRWPDGRVKVLRRDPNWTHEDLIRDLWFRNLVLGGGSGAVVRRAMFEAAGGFDETLRGGGEDWDLWIRLAAQGRFGYVDEVFVHRQERTDSMSRQIDRMLESDLRVFAKHIPLFRAQGMSSLRARTSRAAILRRSGVAYFCSGDRGKAWSALARSAWLNPADIKTLVPLAKLCLHLRHEHKKK